ncbi:MAG TPA: transglutaminase domain-containing protein [Bacteroidia bacterium]|nr:transglutaminase domain-containing protein [Bacteroidia bacterium]HOZ89288.1 transglutaminase domain-containing protein [Bacteroidia bacterium]HQW17564.1 transglutaminase domain-containing protein [Bacteroidia bacterium]HQW48957.1 transglutaminase domain-containing protein [Bacteroidia bacterium]HQX69134.1 transglutaminase domain-containing protein [Bacteroidia bacterium]
MLHKSFFTAIVFLFLSTSLFSQKRIKIPVLDYGSVDEFVLKLKPEQCVNIDTLAEVISREFDRPHFRFRAAFRWITENIAYDLKNQRHPQKANLNANDVFKNKTALAEGYANILNAICAKMNITCLSVNGYLRRNQLPGTKIKKPNHIWSTVKLYDKWYLMDVMMASGYFEKGDKIFTKRFTERYFALHPRQIILTHLPLNGNRQYLDTIVDKNTFLNYPEVYDFFFDNGIYALRPADGVLPVYKGLKKRFYFKSMDSLAIGKIEIRDGKKSEKIQNTFTQVDSLVYFDYVFESNKKRTLDVFVDGLPLCTYFIVPDKKKKRSEY